MPRDWSGSRPVYAGNAPTRLMAGMFCVTSTEPEDNLSASQESPRGSVSHADLDHWLKRGATGAFVARVTGIGV